MAPSEPSRDWAFTPQSLARAITARTRGILVNTPANPSGKVFTREELGWIAAAAREHDLFVITDEIYERFLYDGAEHVAPATLPGMRERTITIAGLSKTFAITGWRIGWAAADARWIPAIGRFSDLAYVCAPTPLQKACAVGLESLGDDFYSRLQADYRSKRDRLCSALSAAGLRPYVPQGSYYVLADLSLLSDGSDRSDRSDLSESVSEALALELLRRTGVASVPGDAFYDSAAEARLARFCFAKKDRDLDEACRRLRGFA